MLGCWDVYAAHSANCLSLKSAKSPKSTRNLKSAVRAETKVLSRDLAKYKADRISKCPRDKTLTKRQGLSILSIDAGASRSWSIRKSRSVSRSEKSDLKTGTIHFHHMRMDNPNFSLLCFRPGPSFERELGEDINIRKFAFQTAERSRLG